MRRAHNAAEGVRWYRKAAEQGHAHAQNNLGLMYYKGLGVAQDDAEAGRWFRKAAEQGHAEAQFYLAFMILSQRPCWPPEEGHRIMPSPRRAERA